MKKMRLVAVFLGMSLVFSGLFGVSAKEGKFGLKGVKYPKDLGVFRKSNKINLKKTKMKGENNKKINILKDAAQNVGQEIYGQFDYFFNDGSMNRKYYGKQQNESREIQPGNEGQFDNKTNINHVLALYIISLNAVKGALVEVLNENGVKLPKDCKINYLMGKLSTKPLANITKKDVEKILFYFGMCCTDVGVYTKSFGVNGTQFFSIRKGAGKFLQKVFNKMGKIKLTESMFSDGRYFAIKIVNDKLKDRLKKKKEIVKYEDEGYYIKYNNSLKRMILELKKANFKRVKGACGVFECKKALRGERVFNKGEAKG